MSLGMEWVGEDESWCPLDSPCECRAPKEPHPSLLVVPLCPPPAIGFSSSKRAFFFTTLKVKKRALKPINTSIYILR